MEKDLKNLAMRVGEGLLERKLMLATAESCTGGWVAQIVTSVSGSSQWFERGFVCYSNQSKSEMLGVRAESLSRHGAVSDEVVREMAEGALRYSHAQVSLAISGIAGPGGDTPGKPVGTVCLAWAVAGRVVLSRTEYFNGNRAAVRWQAMIASLTGLLGLLERWQ